MNGLPIYGLHIYRCENPKRTRTMCPHHHHLCYGGKWQNAALLNGYTDSDDAMPHEEYVTWQRNFEYTPAICAASTQKSNDLARLC